MQNNVRNGLRSIHRHSLSRSAASLNVVGRTQTLAPCNGQRSIAQSATSRKAIPFSLNTYSGPQDAEKDERVVRMLMFGKPGAGKGTLTARLAQKYNILTLSTGDLLRQHIAERTEVGREAEGIIARGELVPDEIVLKVVTSKLDALQNKVRMLIAPLL